MKSLRQLSNLSGIKNNNLLIKSIYSYISRKIINNQLSNERNICFKKSNRPVKSMAHNTEEYEYNAFFVQYYESVVESANYNNLNYFKYARNKANNEKDY